MMCGDWESYVYLCTYFLKEVGELPILVAVMEEFLGIP